LTQLLMDRHGEIAWWVRRNDCSVFNALAGTQWLACERCLEVSET